MKRLLGAVFAMVLAAGPGGPARADDKDSECHPRQGDQGPRRRREAQEGRGDLLEVEGDDHLQRQRQRDQGPRDCQGLDHYRRSWKGNSAARPARSCRPERRQGLAEVRRGPDGDGRERRRQPEAALSPGSRRSRSCRSRGRTSSSRPRREVDDKPAVGIKVTGPDSKDFTLYFDKESGLPVKLVAKVIGFRGDEYTRDDLHYRTTRTSTGSRRPPRSKQARRRRLHEVRDHRVQGPGKVDPKTFAEPE